MADYKIYEDFLDKQDFLDIKNTFTKEDSTDIPWFSGVVTDDEHFIADPKYNLQLGHLFFSNYQVNSSFFYLIDPFIRRLNPKAILRIKANLVPAGEKIVEHAYHVDIPDVTTGVYYVNTNNGYTVFEDGDKVESVENRFVLFDSNQRHTGTNCTDQRARFVINFNFVF